MEKLYVAFKNIRGVKGAYICKVLDVDERRNKWIVDKTRIFYKSDKDIRIYRPDYDTVAMDNYEWLYELTEDEYTDLLERAKECT